MWQGRGIQGRVKGQLSERQVSRTGRGRSTSLGLVKVFVTVARAALFCSLLNFAVWPCMNLTEDLDRPGAVGQ